MVYEVFVSHVSADKRIAEAVKRVINNAFSGDIKLYLAAHELGAGDDWRQELKKNLASCTALISIITPASLNRPWILIEWSAFWIGEKKYYSLLGDGIEVSDLIEPMKDLQAVKMLNEDEVKRFFRKLSEDVGRAEVPYEYVDLFIQEIRLAQNLQDQEQREKTFERYRNQPRNLPQSDEEKRKIADYFYEKGDYDIFCEIVAAIRDNSDKARIAQELIEKGDLEHLKDVVDVIAPANYLRVVAETLAEQGFLDAKLLRDILEDISHKNQAELRKFCIRLAELGQEETSLFQYTQDLLTQNLAELRKVASFFITNGRYESEVFDGLIDIIGASNRAVLRQLAGDFILQGLQRTPKFDHIMKLLASGNQSETEKAMRELAEHDHELFVTYLQQGLISKSDSRERLNKLIEQKPK